MSELLKNYEKSEETIKKLYDSKLRLGILDALVDGPLRLADLRREIGANAPNTSAKAKELEEMGLLERISGDYALTVWGKATLVEIERTVKFYGVLEKFKPFWSTHDLSCIPDELWGAIDILSKASLVHTDEKEIMKVINEFIKVFSETKKFYYIISPFSPFFDPRLFDIYAKHCASGVDGKIITTDKILKEMAKEHPEKIAELFESKSFEFLVYPGELRLATTTADNLFSLGLFSKSTDKYDLTNDLMSQDKEVIDWGMRLFKYYESKSKVAKKEDYL